MLHDHYFPQHCYWLRLLMIIKLMGEGDDYKWWSMIMDWIIPENSLRLAPVSQTIKIQQVNMSHIYIYLPSIISIINRFLSSINSAKGSLSPQALPCHCLVRPRSASNFAHARRRALTPAVVTRWRPGALGKCWGNAEMGRFDWKLMCLLGRTNN